MDQFVTVLSVVAPVFLLAALGFSWVRLGAAYDTVFVTRLAMTFAVPCLVFVSLMQADLEPGAVADMLLAALVGYVLLGLVAWGVVWAMGLEARTYLNPLIFANTGNLGLPIALFALGDSGLALAMIVFAMTSVLSFTFGVWMVAGGGSPLVAIKEPLVGATVAGLVFLILGWETPEWLTRSLSLIGQMAIPMMLITLGVALARLRVMRLGPAIALSLGKLIVGIAIAVITAWIFNLSWLGTSALVLQLAMPVAVSSYLLAEKYGADGPEVAALVVVSTALSVVSLPLMLAFML